MKKNWFIQFFFSVKSIKIYGLKELSQDLIKQKKITTKLKRGRKLFPNNPITNKIIRPVESLKSKTKRRKKNNEKNENKDQG